MNYNVILAQGLSLKKILNGQLADLKGEYNGNLNNSLIITQEGFGKYSFIDNIHKKIFKINAWKPSPKFVLIPVICRVLPCSVLTVRLCIRLSCSRKVLKWNGNLYSHFCKNNFKMLTWPKNDYFQPVNTLLVLWFDTIIDQEAMLH